MGVNWSSRLRIAFVGSTVFVVFPAKGQDLPPLPGESRPTRPIKVDAPAEPLRSPFEQAKGLLKVAEPLPVNRSVYDRFWSLARSSDTGSGPARSGPLAARAAEVPEAPASDPTADRGRVKEELDKLPRNDAKDATVVSKALRALLEERLALMTEWDKVVKERQAAENPDSSPDKLAAHWKAELERLRATLEQTVKSPDALLPASFRKIPAHVPDASLAEMKEAIEASQAELKDWSAKLEQVRSDPSLKPGIATGEARGRRDKTQQQLTGLRARNADRELAIAGARTNEARDLAREALTNGRLELRIEAERLRGQEVMLALETRRTEVSGLNLQMLEAHVQLAQRTLDGMKDRYKAIALKQEQALHQAAVKEQTRAEQSDDPLERYRARRAATLLELEARVVTNENALATNPPPSYDEQHALAERAESDFTGVKKLLVDGKISHLDALRLNNDFRRLGGERARIVGRDLAAAADRLTRAENALSAVELEMVYDSRDDRFELESLLERVPAARHRQAFSIFEDFERKHLALLARRRTALDKLAERADETHQEVLRRLRILDDHFGFIRTHMFWVRDNEAIGESTLAQAKRELQQLARASLRIGSEVSDPSAWGRLSAEFLSAMVGLAILPWPLRRAHQALRALSTRPHSASNA